MTNLTSILPPVFPPITCFRRCDKSNRTSFFLLYTGCSLIPWHYVIPLFFHTDNPTDLLHPPPAPTFPSFHTQPSIPLPTALALLTFNDVHASYCLNLFMQFTVNLILFCTAYFTALCNGLHHTVANFLLYLSFRASQVYNIQGYSKWFSGV